MENESLKLKQIEIAKGLIPAIVPTAFMTVAGIVGNILAIVFFSKQSKQTVPVVLIKCLAVADLATCIVSIPIISEMVLNIRYDRKANLLCKVSHFMGNWTNGSSCIFLVAINIDRYRKICYPFGRQIPVTFSKYIAICIVFIAMLSSGRLFVTFDVKEVIIKVTNSSYANETVRGVHCVASCGDNYETLCIVSYFLDFIAILICVVVAMFLYSRIVYSLLKHKNKMGKIAYGGINNPTKTESNDKIKTIFNGGTITQHVCSCNIVSQTTLASVLKKRKVERSITVMMFSTTIVFLLCFSPYVFIRILLRLVWKSDEENNYNALTQFCLKLPYFNSTINPIIYSIFNVEFRRFIKSFLFKCLNCCRQ